MHHSEKPASSRVLRMQRRALLCGKAIGPALFRQLCSTGTGVDLSSHPAQSSYQSLDALRQVLSALNSAKDCMKRQDPQYNTIECTIPARRAPGHALGLGSRDAMKIRSTPGIAYISAASSGFLRMLPGGGEVAFRGETISALETPE